MINHSIQDLVKQELERQLRGLELIASENFISPAVRQTTASVLTHKYAEGYPQKRYYGGCEIVDEVEELARLNLKKLFRAEWVNVQPHSGSQANAAVMLALLKPGDKILGFDLSHGGHLTHGSPVSFSGKYYQAFFYGLEAETGLIDWNKVEHQAQKHKPKLIICGASAYARDWDYAALRTIADKIGALLLGDIAHTAGLIATKLLNDALEFCHIVTSTTHKTLRGPRGGIIMMRRDALNPFNLKTSKGKLRRLSTLLNSGVFPGAQGGPLMHVIAAKALAFEEAIQPKFTDYMKQVQQNARSMAANFQAKGYKIISGGTDNHLMLLDLRSKNITGLEAEKTLGKVDITVNKNMVPFDDKPANITSGIRIGTPAITTRGLGANDMSRVVDIIDQALNNQNNETLLASLKREVNEWMYEYPLFKV